MLVRSDRRLITALVIFVLVPLVWFVGVDMVQYANDWPRLRDRLIVRALGILLACSGLLVIRTVHTRKAYSAAVLGFGLATVVLQLANNLLRVQGSMLPMRSPLMFLIVMYGAMPNSFIRQILLPLTYSAGIIAERSLWLTNNLAGDFPSDVLILVFVNAIGIVMVYRRVALEREIGLRFLAERDAAIAARQALSDLGALRGIIPICSHCRKVRMEDGDWQQLELYVSAHTEADFSHGVCPDCAKTMYAKFRQ